MINKGIVFGVLSLAIIGAGAYGYNAFASSQPGRMMGQFGSNRLVEEKDAARFVQMHNLMAEGKIDEANAIRVELGMGQAGGRGRGMMGAQQRGQNKNGNFVDVNNDGICDHMQQ